jgi:hypothetical protein
VVGVGLLTVFGLATAVTLPVVLDGRESTATAGLRTRLQQVADAQVAWKAEHGAYTTRLADLGPGADGEGELAIVRADDTGFCVGVYDSHADSAIFYSPTTGFSSTSCS